MLAPRGLPAVQGMASFRWRVRCRRANITHRTTGHAGVGGTNEIHVCRKTTGTGPGLWALRQAECARGLVWGWFRLSSDPHAAGCVPLENTYKRNHVESRHGPWTHRLAKVTKFFPMSDLLKQLNFGPRVFIQSKDVYMF